MQVGSVRDCAHRHRPGGEISPCPGLVEGSSGLDRQAWAAVAGEEWKIMFLSRLSPVFPFTLLNYAFGLTRVRLGQYVLASWIGMMLGTVMYAYLGSLVNVGAGHRQRTTGEWVLYGVGLLATMAVTIFVTRVARKALEKKISSAETIRNSRSL